MPELSGPGYGVEGPAQLAGLRVVGLDAPARPHIASGKPRDDHAVVIERGAGDDVAGLGIFGLDRPAHLAGLLIEGHQLGIQLADEHHAVAESKSTSDP